MYVIISTYTGNTTCDHCGRGIKNIVQVKDTNTGDILNVGMTCIQTLMGLSETLDKKIQKELTKYNKLKKESIELSDIENQVNKHIENIKNGNVEASVWDDLIQGYRKPTLEETDINSVRKTKEFAYKLANEKLNKQILALNKITKNGLIKIEAV